MNVAIDAPTRPALRYYGGKWKLAPWIIGHFPPHKNYVEPCGGAASVLLTLAAKGIGNAVPPLMYQKVIEGLLP